MLQAVVNLFRNIEIKSFWFRVEISIQVLVIFKTLILLFQQQLIPAVILNVYFVFQVDLQFFELICSDFNEYLLLYLILVVDIFQST